MYTVLKHTLYIILTRDPIQLIGLWFNINNIPITAIFMTKINMLNDGSVINQWARKLGWPQYKEDIQMIRWSENFAMQRPIACCSKGTGVSDPLCVRSWSFSIHETLIYVLGGELYIKFVQHSLAETIWGLGCTPQ
jgi:hypothetical protein